MKTNPYPCRAKGTAMVEVIIVVLCVIVIAVGFLLPAKRSGGPSQRIRCVSHLKQVALGFRIYANDNNDEFPWTFSTNNGGTHEWVGSTQIFRHFQASSNEIQSPKVLVCPGDTRSTPAKSFDSLANTNISYFINLANTNDAKGSDLLIGDRGLIINGSELTTGNYWIPTQQVLQWGPRPHNGNGNIGLTDGSVQQTTSANLQKAILNASLATNYLAIP